MVIALLPVTTSVDGFVYRLSKEVANSLNPRQARHASINLLLKRINLSY